MDQTLPAAMPALPALPAHSSGMPFALALFTDDRLFARAKELAEFLAKAQGFTPQHLIGKTHACFAVVERALTWRLSPFAVAQSTYETPGGRVGYEGKLCHAILENSGRIEGGIQYTHYGDWAKVFRKFEIRKSAKGNDYTAATWTDKDAEGLGVTVSAQVKGEKEPRTLDFDLLQAYPRNSTLWATDPKTQICYTAVRRFASVCVPQLFMGVPFDVEDDQPRGPKDMGTAEVVQEPKPPRPSAAAKARAAAGVGAEPAAALITTAQAHDLRNLLQMAQRTESDLCTRYSIVTLADLPAASYEAAASTLRKSIEISLADLERVREAAAQGADVLRQVAGALPPRRREAIADEIAQLLAQALQDAQARREQAVQTARQAGDGDALAVLLDRLRGDCSPEEFAALQEVAS